MKRFILGITIVLSSIAQAQDKDELGYDSESWAACGGFYQQSAIEAALARRVDYDGDQSYNYMKCHKREGSYYFVEYFLDGGLHTYVFYDKLLKINGETGNIELRCIAGDKTISNWQICEALRAIMETKVVRSALMESLKSFRFKNEYCEKNLNALAAEICGLPPEGFKEIYRFENRMQTTAEDSIEERVTFDWNELLFIKMKKYTDYTDKGNFDDRSPYCEIQIECRALKK